MRRSGVRYYIGPLNHGIQFRHNLIDFAVGFTMNNTLDYFRQDSESSGQLELRGHLYLACICGQMIRISDRNGAISLDCWIIHKALCDIVQ